MLPAVTGQQRSDLRLPFSFRAGPTSTTRCDTNRTFLIAYVRRREADTKFDQHTTCSHTLPSLTSNKKMKPAVLTLRCKGSTLPRSRT